MKSKTRNILIVVGALVSITLGIVGYGTYRIYSFFSQFKPKEIPEEIKEGRVLLGKEILTKTLFFRKDAESLIKIAGDGSKIKDEKARQKLLKSESGKRVYGFDDLQVIGQSVIAVGRFGTYFLDLDGNLKREVLFDPVTEKIRIGPYEREVYQSDLENLRIVNLDKDRIGFLSFGLREGARVFDENGNQIWSIGEQQGEVSDIFKDQKDWDEEYDRSTYVLQAAVGDLDNDGVSEYIVARKKDGVRAYDRKGTELWFEPADFPNGKLAVVDLDTDGRNELLAFRDGVRDGGGKFLKKLKGDCDAFVFSEDKDKKLGIGFLDMSDGKARYSDEAGKTVFEGPAPLSKIQLEPKKVEIPGYPEMSYVNDDESVAYPKAVWVTLTAGRPKYLVIVASYIGVPRSNLYVFQPDGTLIYHELLDEDAETIAVMPSVNGKEQLLVGGKDTIWRYAAN